MGIVPFSNGQELATEKFSKLLPLFAHNSIARAGLTEDWLLRLRALRFEAVFQVIANISAVVGTGNGMCALHTFSQGNPCKSSPSPGEPVLSPLSLVYSLHPLWLSYRYRLKGAARCAASLPPLPPLMAWSFLLGMFSLDSFRCLWLNSPSTIKIFPTTMGRSSHVFISTQ